MRRDAIPLHKNRHAMFVEAIHDHPNDHKSITGHLGIGTGARNSTIGHIRGDWFFYDGDGNLYLQIPGSDDCKKGDGNGTCGACDETGFSPKTEASNGRQILIKNEWTNHANNQKREYFGLKDHVESYFALTGKNAPDDVKYGHEMIKGNGVSRTAANRWIRDIAAKSPIQPQIRKSRLKKAGVPDNEDGDEIMDFGYDNKGNAIPDMQFHDLRACFCTQYARNEVPPTKAIEKTGHADPDSLKPYIMFAANEIDPQEEEKWY